MTKPELDLTQFPDKGVVHVAWLDFIGDPPALVKIMSPNRENGFFAFSEIDGKAVGTCNLIELSHYTVIQDGAIIFESEEMLDELLSEQAIFKILSDEEMSRPLTNEQRIMLGSPLSDVVYEDCEHKDNCSETEPCSLHGRNE